MDRKLLRRLLSIVCAFVLCMSLSGVAVLADVMEEEEIISVQDAESVQEDEQIIDEQIEVEQPEELLIDEAEEEAVVGAGQYAVGNGVTADFDAASGEVVFYSNGGTLWKDWISTSGFSADEIKSIRTDDSSGTVYLPEDSSYIFSQCTNLKEADFSKFDTSNVTNMSGMFDCCFSLTDLDLTGFDTRNVTDMSRMFNMEKYYDDSTYRIGGALSTLTIYSFDTTEVKNMEGMFCGCSSLTELDLSSFNTIGVQDMANMFRGCSSLTDLDLGNFDTPGVRDMGGMFDSCRSLVYLNLTSFNTMGVMNMQRMFRDCSSLTVLDMSSCETSRVTDMTDMFKDCAALAKLITPRTWNLTTGLPKTMYDRDGNQYTSMPTRSDSMILAISPELAQDSGNDIFYGLTVGDGVTAQLAVENGEVILYLDSGNGTLWDNWLYIIGKPAAIVDAIRFTEDSTTMRLPEDCSRLFDGTELRSLKSIELDKVSTSGVTSMYYMFADCDGLTELDLSGFNTESVTNMSSMFAFCTNLTYLDLSSFVTPNLMNMSAMFRDCSNLTGVNFGPFDTSNVSNMSWLFSGCKKLTDLDLSGFVTTNVTTMYWMFRECSSLESLDISNFDTINVTNMSAMFNKCSSLPILDLSSFDTSNVYSMTNMFTDCDGLQILITPGTNAIEPDLPVTMYDSSGNSYWYLPVLSESIVLAISQEMAQEYEGGDEPDPNPAVVYAANLALTGRIGVNIKLTLPDAIISDPDSYVEMGYSGEDEVVTTTLISDADIEAGHYVFTCPVAVKEINDPVYIKVYYGDGRQAGLVKGESARLPIEGNCFRYAVSDYIESKKDKTTPIGGLVRALSDFGASARIYFNYETEGAEILADLSDITADDLQDYNMVLTDQAAQGIRIYSANLALESDTSINVKFESTEDGFDIDNYSFAVNGEEAVPTVASDGRYQITIGNIAAKELDDMFTVSVTDAGGNTQSILYGALSYAFSKLSNSASDEDIINLSKCLYLYNQASNTYFND